MTWAGAAAVLLCALTWGTGLLYFGGERRPASGLYAAGTPLLAGGAMLLVASALFGEPARVTAASFSPIALGSLAYLIVFGSVITFTALTWLTETQGADRAASYAYVNPLVAVLLGLGVRGRARRRARAGGGRGDHPGGGADHQGKSGAGVGGGADAPAGGLRPAGAAGC